jgi:hypothetical protein
MGVRKVSDDSPAVRSGTVAVVGVVERLPRNPMVIDSWRDFINILGETSAVSLPEAEQVFLNGAGSVVLAGVEGGYKAHLRTPFITLEARVPGGWGNAIAVEIRPKTLDAQDLPYYLIDLFISYRNGERLETHTDLRIPSPAAEAADNRFTPPGHAIIDHIHLNSALISVTKVGDKDAFETAFSQATTFQDFLSGGEWPLISEYRYALELLESHEDIDIVTVSIPMEFYGKPGKDDATRLHDALLEHVMTLAKRAMPRFAVGTINPLASDSVTDAVRRARRIANDRFILTAPFGVLGAVAGALASTPMGHSPSLKQLRGVDRVSANYTRHELETLVKNGVLAVGIKTNPGAFIQKGVSTSGQPVGVTKIADQILENAARVTERFIGKPHTRSAVMAIDAAVHGYLADLEKRGMLVRRGNSPAFVVHAYSSNEDYAQGIVRVDVGIRPVRAIEYIYGTIVVQT